MWCEKHEHKFGWKTYFEFDVCGVSNGKKMSRAGFYDVVRVSMMSLLSGRLEKYTASGVRESVCRNETAIWVLAVKIVIVEAGNTQPTILQQVIPRGRRTWCGWDATCQCVGWTGCSRNSIAELRRSPLTMSVVKRKWTLIARWPEGKRMLHVGVSGVLFKLVWKYNVEKYWSVRRGGFDSFTDFGKTKEHWFVQ